MVVNLGSIFVTLIVILTIPVFLLMFLPCKNKFQWLHNKHTSLTNAYYGNMWTRYMLEGCLDISISLAL